MADKITLSRGPSIDTQKCVENVGGNRFDLVLIASVRVKEISRKNRHSPHRHHIFPAVTALQEIQDGVIGAEYLMKV